MRFRSNLRRVISVKTPKYKHPVFGDAEFSIAMWVKSALEVYDAYGEFPKLYDMNPTTRMFISLTAMFVDENGTEENIVFPEMARLLNKYVESPKLKMTYYQILCDPNFRKKFLEFLKTVKKHRDVLDDGWKLLGLAIADAVEKLETYSSHMCQKVEEG